MYVGIRYLKSLAVQATISSAENTLERTVPSGHEARTMDRRTSEKRESEKYKNQIE